MQNFLLHFWQGMPPHIIPILSSSTIANLVGVCDSVLYNAITGVLMPTVLQALPERYSNITFNSINYLLIIFKQYKLFLTDSNLSDHWMYSGENYFS